MAIVMYPIVELPARPVEALIVPVGEPGADPVEARGWSVLNRVCSRGQCQPRRSAGPVRRTGAVTAAPRARGVVAVAADLKEALLRANYVEELADIYYRTLTVLGHEPETIPADELAQWKYPTV